MRAVGVFLLPIVTGAASLACERDAEAPIPEPHVRPAIAMIAAPTPSTRAIAAPTATPTATPSAVASASPLTPDLVDDGSDDLPDDAAPPKAPSKAATDELASIAHETWVYAEPRWSSRRIGYMRAGAVVERSHDPSGHAGCVEGWYRVAPRGYVCVGPTASLDIFSRVVEASKRRAVRDDGLPYTYVMSRFPAPPFYARLPSAEETLKVEPDLARHLREVTRAQHDPSWVEPPPPDPTPNVLLYGQGVPAFGGSPPHGPNQLTLGHARARSGFALLSTFEHEGRRFGLTTDLAVLPLDRTRVIKPSAFHGITLDEQTTLPVAFTHKHHATRWVVSPQGSVTRGDPLEFRQAIAVTDRTRKVGGVAYLEATDGSLLAEDDVVKIDKLHTPPAWSSGHRKWIDVSILHQSLVAYEGTKPVYVTLVSTGADGLGDPKKTHSTIQGAFLIHTKHVSVTMDDDKIGDEFDFRDVPFVQYFTEGFALHAAYWHDEFGTPRSHGCVNLAPIDASKLFAWTDPEVPAAWHGALSLKKGTLVYTHP
jgi:hypothetical protein